MNKKTAILIALLSLVLISIVVYAIECKSSSDVSQPFVQTPLGGILGNYKKSYNGRQYEAYEGIPYAIPPVGERRFQPPEPVKAWTGNLTAFQPRSPCVQYEHVHINYTVHGDENCLYLNVYVPSNPKTEKPLPVLFAIHGGAFQYYRAFTGMQFLMDRDIVVVSISYRLGIFGFLSTEDEYIPGNMGLKDQSMALNWTSKNIGYFGGDPTRITLIGNSAGGASVHYHYLSPLSKDLFRNGIALSGTTFGPGKICENSREKAMKLGAIMNCPTSDIPMMIKCLQNRPAYNISEASRHFMPWLYNPFTPFGPVVENNTHRPFINRKPIEIITSGDAADKLWITSTVSAEGLYPAAEFIDNDYYMNDLDKRWDSIAPHLLDYNFTIPLKEHAQVAQKIRKHYLGDEVISKQTSKRLVDMIGDRLYVFDGQKAAVVQAKINKSPVLFFRFNYRSLNSLSDFYSNTTKDFGVSHADDALLIFDNPVIYPPKRSSDRAMQVKLLDLVLSVASKGYPDLELDFEWKPVNGSTDELDYLEIDGPTAMRMEKSDNYGEKQFWSTIDFDENKLDKLKAAAGSL